MSASRNEDPYYNGGGSCVSPVELSVISFFQLLVVIQSQDLRRQTEKPGFS